MLHAGIETRTHEPTSMYPQNQPKVYVRCKNVNWTKSEVYMPNQNSNIKYRPFQTVIAYKSFTHITKIEQSNHNLVKILHLKEKEVQLVI